MDRLWAGQQQSAAGVLSFAARMQGSSRAGSGRGTSSASQGPSAPDAADAELGTPIVRRGSGSTATFFTKVSCALLLPLGGPFMPLRAQDPIHNMSAYLHRLTASYASTMSLSVD